MVATQLCTAKREIQDLEAKSKLLSALLVAQNQQHSVELDNLDKRLNDKLAQHDKERKDELAVIEQKLKDSNTLAEQAVSARLEFEQAVVLEREARERTAAARSQRKDSALAP